MPVTTIIHRAQKQYAYLTFVYEYVTMTYQIVNILSKILLSSNCFVGEKLHSRLILYIWPSCVIN